jgi:hypothetical protein
MAVIDHFSHDPADPSHATVVATNFVDSKAVFGGRSPVRDCTRYCCTVGVAACWYCPLNAGLTSDSCEPDAGGLQAPVLYRGIGLSVPPESSLVSHCLSTKHHLQC